MTIQSGQYRLQFAIAGRSFLSIPMAVDHVPAFGRFPVSTLRNRELRSSCFLGAACVFWSSELDEAFPDHLREDGRLYYVMQRLPRYVTQFEGSFEDLLAGLSAKRRSTLRRKVRKFAKEGDSEQIEWREYRSPEELEAFFDIAMPLARKTYQARLFDGALPADPDFKAKGLLAAQKGLLRAYILFLGAAPVAYLYAPQEDDRLVYAYLGYDPSYAHLSPGTVLQYLVHERLFEDSGISSFDFTAGEGDHKALFANRRFECCDVLCVPDTARWRFLLGAHRAWGNMVFKLGESAESLGLKAKLRRIVRGQS